MARVPPIRRLSTEDYQSQTEWIGPLLSQINDYMERTTSALNRALTVNDNMAGELRTVEVDGTYPLKLVWTLNKPSAVIVGNTVLSSGASLTLTEAVQVQWSYNQSGQLQIDNVVGVTPSASTKYKLTLLILTA